MLVVGGSASEDLSKKASEELGCDFVPVERKRFPDGEIYVRLTEEVEGEEAVVIQSTCHPPNQNYMELFLLLDAVRDLGAEKVTTVIPYLAYARQDERFEPGEAVSLETVAKLIQCAGAEEVCLIDLHAHRIGSAPEVFDVPARNLTASPLLAKYFDDKYSLKDPVVMGPDGEAQQWAEKAGNAIGTDWDYMIKERLGDEEVEITPRELDVEGRDVMIVDDIISTGGTMTEAIGILKDHGAEGIYAACTHPVLSGNALQNMKEAGAKDVVATDTIGSEISKVSVAPVVAEAVK